MTLSPLVRLDGLPIDGVRFSTWKLLLRISRVLQLPAAKSPPRRPDPCGEYHGWRADVGCLADHWEDTHVVFLLGSLRSLAQPTLHAKEREEILRWLDASLVKHPAPFSFQACLALYDPRLDAEEVQGLVHRILQRPSPVGALASRSSIASPS